MGNHQDKANPDFGTFRNITHEKDPSFDSTDGESGEITTGDCKWKLEEVTMPVSFMYIHELWSDDNRGSS